VLLTSKQPYSARNLLTKPVK